jgi:hypothetical protein
MRDCAAETKTAENLRALNTVPRHISHGCADIDVVQQAGQPPLVRIVILRHGHFAHDGLDRARVIQVLFLLHP